ncbi:hypothetical protein AAU57_10815 [Nonlabens sp. YIK11]|uniref:hypothetical protein n=1 Tax=Nonlabens sp. YIK11 TaxID=1453349 RepID=UPI0006DC2EDF|nr:hypothetical protein [Nonlabens sp. YIK11]KQC33767.1 hypothetical protein AAU57_10815 [Nonlabens sp. YIK11]
MFKNDLFTKSMLGVIALNLSILSATMLSNNDTHASVPNLPVNKDGSINVRLSNTETIDVNISRISTMDELDVNVEEIGGGFVRHGGPIPVKIED